VSTASTGPVGASTADTHELITAHLPLVNHLVRELLSKVPAHIRREDLFSVGSVALVAAANCFDSSRGVPFVSYATVRVRGALVDELRDRDWASRSLRSRARRLRVACDEFAAAHGREPTTAELAEATGLTARELATLQQELWRGAVLSLQSFAQDSREDVLPEPRPSPENLLIERERIGYLHDAIDALPDRMRAVVRGYFIEERPMADIAMALGVTESRVSQLRAEALSLLRDGLNAQLDPQLLTDPERPGSCVARRRSRYFDAVAAQGDLRSRLARTTRTGLPAQ